MPQVGTVTSSFRAPLPTLREENVDISVITRRIMCALSLLGQDRLRYQVESLSQGQKEISVLQQARLDHMTKVAKREKESEQWSVVAQVSSFTFSCMTIVTGASMATPTAAAFIIGGGLLTICDQAVRMTVGWEQVAEILPFEDKERAVQWIQTGSTTLGISLALGGGVIGGFQAVSAGLQQFGNVMGSSSLLLQAISSAGESISSARYQETLAEAIHYKVLILPLNESQEKCSDSAERILEELTSFMSLAKKSLEDEKRFFSSLNNVGRR